MELISRVDSIKSVELLTDLVVGLDDTEVNLYSVGLFNNNSQYRDLFLQMLGSDILKYTNVVELFDTLNKEEKLGLIFAVGFMSNPSINNWLVSALYNKDDDISSSAVFALSKRGSSGYRLLAENLIDLSDRIKMISLDLLTYNKVYAVYDKFPELLTTKNDLIAKKIFNVYRSLGERAELYILNSLKLAHKDYLLQLLEILDDLENKDYLGNIYYLIDNPLVQGKIIELYFNNESVYLLRKILLSQEIEVVDMVIDYAIKNNSVLLFANKQISDLVLSNFLSHYQTSSVIGYFESIGIDNNYIDDYQSLETIYRAIAVLKDVEGKNGEVDYISKYFEFEQSQVIAQQELSIFYNGMKSWLKSGNIEDLDRSLAIKSAKNASSGSIEDEKRSFVDALTEDERSILLSYEKSKKDISRNYRTLSFRLKYFAQKIINESGYQHLIE
ncbi:hypothetical protein EW093_10015 [Thiospirochaeta perfilievii]|uniref:Uncharacterized protein n=1 Tax=Thiospirochaeta perfilievii TaxID=252967 RepID=A0A5C1QBX2_9SPIO|nr:hypothetical protein [Thiospirochaeta perfilievii]QEN05031.1 hypothetical protein EW093_10015 [Thiospirochaeta perfilievii]